MSAGGRTRRGWSLKSPLKKPPGEGTGPTRHPDLRGNLVGRVPPRGEPDVFQQAGWRLRLTGQGFASILQIEHDKAVVFEDWAKAFAKVGVKPAVMFQPPECRPDESNISGSGFSHPLQFADGRPVVRGWAPVGSIPLQERNHT